MNSSSSERLHMPIQIMMGAVMLIPTQTRKNTDMTSARGEKSRARGGSTNLDLTSVSYS